MWERLTKFFGNLIQIDHINKVQDKTNPDLKRGYSISTENGFAIIGSGTQYKYQLYFNGKFPFIHQNAIRLNLGESYPTYKGYPVMDVITQGQGQTKLGEVNFPKSGKTQSAVNIYSAQYSSPSTADKMTKNKFGDDPYTKTSNNMQDPSMVGNSMLIGILSVVVTYLIGVPLAILFARNKGKWLDNAGIGMIMILIAVPSLAFIYIFRFIGSALFGLPDLFTTFGAGDFRSYILPTLILAGLSIPGIIQWTRRYMIDQSSADYVKFARAKGLTEKEISHKHIMKNAMIPIAQGIPGAIILTIAGATMTETIFNVPGMGKMLPDALKAHNNAMVVGLTFIFTTLAVLAVLAGDILMTLIDPRIKLSSSKGDN
jgi:oligopeptide transport system permease protein